MRGRLLVLLLALGLGCARPCRTSSECDPGELCSFDDGECHPGCASDAECGPRGVCMTERGLCRYPSLEVPRPTDAGTSTSTAADAG